MVKEQIIRLENVYKHYFMGKSIVKALDGVSVEITKGDLL